jgi:hypothetical protein
VRYRQFMALTWLQRITGRLLPAEQCQAVHALAKIAGHENPVFRQHALAKARELVDEISRISEGEIVFENTETWRTAYQNLLQHLAFNDYYSVAWVRTPAYWNDPPGRQSMELNYQLLGLGLRIERQLILSEQLWPRYSLIPESSIRTWIEEQHFRGISISLIREGDLAPEPDLLRDFGIYGDCATGEQVVDEDARTVRFVLRFSSPSVRQAHDRWARLALFSIPYTKALDQSGTRY